MDVSDAFGTFDATPMASASVAQAHPASLKDGTPVVVKVFHSGAQAKVLDDLELMRVLAGFVEDRDEALAAYSPTVVVDEFDMMMRAAIDLGRSLRTSSCSPRVLPTSMTWSFPGPIPRFPRQAS
jgi:ubiquinone biosynthesis protein